ncbi:V-type ATPase 116kDa subunit family protein [Methylocaldum sp. 14B]|uniref:V-type ATP synthase subunit I n=1 Tax=Methylocaldum sp. 14B TaxID=1912213 RepID=UPI000989B12F|nr:V-type ATPase 116kDa subunit family protein [Methylocaldum sp. 14B]
MFKPLPMQRLTLHTVLEAMPAATLVLAEFGVFEPERIAEGMLPELPAETYRDLVKRAQVRLNKILSHCETPLTIPAAPPRVVPETELAQLDRWLGELWARYSGSFEELRRLTEERKHLDQLMMTLVNFLALDIDLGRLQRPEGLLDIRLGTVPLANVRRLQEALGLANYVLRRFLESDGSAHVVIAGPAGGEASIADLLREAGWRPQQIPEEFKDYPDKVRREFLKRRQEITQAMQAVRETIRACERENQRPLVAAAQTLALAWPYAQLGEALRSRGGLAVMSGWVPKRELPRLEQALRARIEDPLVVTVRDPQRGESVPSCLRHHRLLHPFAALVKNYGVPRYGEFDPTVLFAFTYIAMFGMMYGDVGHGGIIAAAGLLLRERLRGYGPFVTAVGLSSCGFGFLYGSLFGFEDVIPSLWIAPLSNPGLMLEVAGYWGVAFILLATVLAAYNRLSEGRVIEALCDGRGLAGLLFYGGLLYGGYRGLTGAHLGATEILAIALPFAIVLAYQWHENRVPLGERLLVVFIEGFETVMAYLSGTLSFLRVAAFSLNHVALAIAVLTLAQMMGHAGHWITIVLGNIFSLVLEGSIVIIQALRLEYYEGFSRFFRGDGREFRPLILFENVGAGASRHID